MQKVTIDSAKTNLSRLIAAAEAGEEIVILRGDTPVARIVPIEPPSLLREPGRLKGQIEVDASFFDPLPESEFVAWEKG
jgi:prevent-host-death family protein